MRNIVDRSILEHIEQSDGTISVTKRPNVDFNLNNAQKTSCDQFGVIYAFRLRTFIIYLWPKAAAAALIHYAKETREKTALPHIRSIELEQSSDFIALDR